MQRCFHRHPCQTPNGAPGGKLSEIVVFGDMQHPWLGKEQGGGQDATVESNVMIVIGRDGIDGNTVD